MFTANILFLWLQPIFWVTRISRALIGGLLASPFILIALLNSRRGGGLRTPVLTFSDACARVPFGMNFFTFLVGLVAPYSASLVADINSVQPLAARGTLYDRPWMRNPFNSIHAIALTNFGELIAGCAVMAGMEDLQRSTALKVRGIVSGVKIEFEKKARGPIRATSVVEIPKQLGTHVIKAVAVLTDQRDVKVAEFTASWTINISKQ